MKKEKEKTAVIYARYSNERHQKETSIEDQITQGNIIAERFGYKVVRVYKDSGISGEAIEDRPGAMALMAAVDSRQFDAIIVENLSRLARDIELNAHVVKRCRFANVELIDVGGNVSDMSASFQGIINAEFIKNLRTSVRRSMNGCVLKGLVPGTVAFGYRGIKETLANGLVRFKPGVREIDPVTSAVVIRIFTEYASGKSPREIAAGLSKDGIPTPRGAEFWNPGKIVSGGDLGIIGNQIYIGKIVWNAHTHIKHPITKKRTQRKGNPEDLLVVDAPELRIVPQDLWDRAQALRASRSTAKFGPARKRANNLKSAEQFFLVGLLRCGVCNGNMTIGQSNMDGSPRVVCSYGHRRMGCDHHKSYCLKVLEATVLAGVKERLTDPQAVIRYTKEYHARWSQRQKEIKVDRDAVQRDLNVVTAKRDRTLIAITDDDEPVPALVVKYKELEGKRLILAERLAQIDRETNVVTLHPKAISAFCANMTTLHDALSGKKPISDLMPFREAFRSVFEGIVVQRTANRAPYEVIPYARLSAITQIDLFPKARSTKEILANVRAYTNRISQSAGSRWSLNHNKAEGVISLGRWRQAA